MGISVRIGSSWGDFLRTEFEAPYFADLMAFVRSEYAKERVYPQRSKIFRAFDDCPLESVRVVVVGQDPYHGPGQANGLCFSVNPGVSFPPSLVNIFKEVSSDLGTEKPLDGDLGRWADQGVLLLNSILTVRDGNPGSHQGRGWERFTDSVIRLLSEEYEHLVFMLWGGYAQRKGVIIDRSKHLVLEAPHPSPLSVYRGFFGCKHFSRANDYLAALGKDPIRW